MTDIEKQFFEVFGIEPKYKKCEIDYCENQSYECEKCEHFKLTYPSITDRILLQLVCILSPNGFFSISTDDLKIEILTKCLKRERDENIRKQVRALFREAGE